MRGNNKNEPITAAELIAMLRSDPEFVARQEHDEAERQKRVAEWRRAEAPLVQELRAAGYAVESAWDLVNTSSSYTGALPILLKHLGRPYPARVREGIARALAVPEARFAWDRLLELYRHEETRDAKDGLAVALSVVASDDVIDALLDLVRDSRHGGSRLLLLDALERSSDPRARAALLDLAADPELGQEIQRMLRKHSHREEG